RASPPRHGSRNSGERSGGRPGAEPCHRLLGRPEALVEDRPCRVVLPVAALVSQVDPRFELLTTHGANQERGTGLRHDGYAATDPSASSRMSSPRSSSCSPTVSGNNKRMTLS